MKTRPSIIDPSEIGIAAFSYFDVNGDEQPIESVDELGHLLKRKKDGEYINTNFGFTMVAGIDGFGIIAQFRFEEVPEHVSFEQYKGNENQIKNKSGEPTKWFLFQEPEDHEHYIFRGDYLDVVEGIEALDNMATTILTNAGEMIEVIKLPADTIPSNPSSC
jgi:hypothetical protein